MNHRARLGSIVLALVALPLGLVNLGPLAPGGPAAANMPPASRVDYGALG